MLSSGQLVHQESEEAFVLHIWRITHFNKTFKAYSSSLSVQLKCINFWMCSMLSVSTGMST